jgi:single-strand DNA-binding protein
MTTPNRFQVITLTGRLTADPELRTTPKDGKVATLRLAIQRPRKDGVDQGADYVDVAVWGRQGETCAEYLAKGRKVAVEGRLHHSEWDSDNGHRQKLEVVARNVEFLDPRKTDDTNGPTAAEQGAETVESF